MTPSLLAIAMLSLQGSPIPASPIVKPIPRVVINEVLFDPTGIDGGTEWVELYNGGTGSQSLSALQLRTFDGTAVWQGGAGAIPPGGFVVVQFGPSVAEDVDGDPSDGYACFFTNQAPDDVLSNTSGGLTLRVNRVLSDAVFWGVGGPPVGAEYTQAVSAVQWPAGAFVDIGFGGGALQEGDSIGRDTNGADSNTAADWATAGGKNAVRPTPGDRNDLLLATDLDMVRFTQTAVNQVLTYVGASDGNSLSVLAASHTSLVVNDPDAVGGFSVTADHSFTIDRQGLQKVLSGTLTTSYERVGAPYSGSYSLGISGQLADGSGTSLSLNASIQRSGFHSLVRSQTDTFAWTWTENGVSSQASSTRLHTVTQTSSTTWHVSDARTGTDWRGPSTLTVQATLDRTKLDDGVYAEAGSVTMPFPAFPPAPGNTQSVFGTQVWDFAWQQSLDADGGLQRTITRWDVAVLNGSGNPIYGSELVQDGTQSVVRTAGAPFSSVGAWTLDFHTLERLGYPTPDENSPTANRDFTLHQFSSFLGSGELVSQGAATFEYGGSSLGTLGFYIDGPVQGTCGCGCGASDCSCGGAKHRKKLSPENPIAVGGVGLVCAVGGFLAAPSVVGIGLVGGLCGFVAYLWW